MHLLIGTRGNQESVDLFIKELSSKYMNLPFYDKKTGKSVNVVNAVHVRPFQLWEIIFPKEQKDLILTTIFTDKNTGVANPKFKRIYKWICKFLPFQKMPEDWDDSRHFPIQKANIEIIGIGMKDDRMMDFKATDAQMKSIGLDPKKEWEYEGL